MAEQDDLNAVWASYLGAHRPTTTTVEVSRLATHANCKIEISVIAVANDTATAEQTEARAQEAPAPEMTTTLGFVGLGSMGSRMARRLLDAGHALCGYNRTAAKAADLVRAGMTLAVSPRDVAARADVVFTMVTDDTALRCGRRARPRACWPAGARARSSSR